MNSKDKGNLAELAAAKKIISKGMSVAFPFGDNERYDLIIDNDQHLEKAQTGNNQSKNVNWAEDYKI